MNNLKTLDVTDRFYFDPNITDNEKSKIIEQHKVAHSKIDGCQNLTQDQKDALKSAYGKSIRHSVTKDPDVNGKAIVGGSQIWTNFSVLFPKGDREIAQTLIHKMMHCAGFDHPQRTAKDKPFDQGPYYGTPPLQAEICIAGFQSIEQFEIYGEKIPISDCIPGKEGIYTIFTGAADP